MEILQLRYFCHAARCENFSKTAAYYNVPTSNISRAVRCIEKELGAKLFDRTANRLTLTESGRVFYTHVYNALSELELGIDTVKEHLVTPCGELRLLISSCRRIVTKAIEECKQEYPDIRFSVKHGVHEGEYDFVISDIPPSKSQFTVTELMSEKMLLAVPPTSELYGGKLFAESLAKQPFISLGEGTRLHSMTVSICESYGFTPNIAIQTDDPHYVLKYLEMGMGVAFFPQKSWADLAPDKVKLFDVGAPMRRTFVFTEKKPDKNPAKEVFLEILKRVFVETKASDGIKIASL